MLRASALASAPEECSLRARDHGNRLRQPSNAVAANDPRLPVSQPSVCIRLGQRIGTPSFTSVDLFPVDYGFPLWTVYAVWVVVLLLLYPACLWFARLKQRWHDWWVTYL